LERFYALAEVPQPSEMNCANWLTVLIELGGVGPAIGLSEENLTWLSLTGCL